MRIGLISDFEGCAASLEVGLQVCRDEGADLIVHAGDILEVPLSRDPPAETIDRLRDSGAFAIPGNHDRWLLDYGTPRWPTTAWMRLRRRDPLFREEDLPGRIAFWEERLIAGQAAIRAHDRAWLADLPEERTLDLGAAGRVYICHGMPGNPFNSIWPTASPWNDNVGSDDIRAAEMLVRLADPGIILCGHAPDPIQCETRGAHGRAIPVVRAGGRIVVGSRWLAGVAILTAQPGAAEPWRIEHGWHEYTPRDPTARMRFARLSD